jgi:hypothetical protein
MIKVDIRKCCVWVSIYDHGGARAKCRLAEILNECLTCSNRIMRRASHINHSRIADRCLFPLERPRDGNMLLCNQTHGNSVPYGAVEEDTNISARHVSQTFLEACKSVRPAYEERERRDGYPLAMSGMSCAWRSTRSCSTEVYWTLSSSDWIGGCLAKTSKLLRCASRICSM